MSGCAASARSRRLEIPQFGASDLGVDTGAVGEAGAKVKRVDYFVPALGKGAEILTGEQRRDRRQTH